MIANFRDRASAGLKRLQDRVDRVKTRTDGFGNALAGLRRGAVAVGAVGTAFAGVGVAVASVGRRMETLKATLSSVLPEQVATADAFALIQRITKQLPTNIDETSRAFTKMLALGIAPTEDRMVSFGNTAAAMGKSIEQFVEAVADAATGEFERLKDFGITARSEGDKVALTFQQQTTTIGKNANEIVDYLERIGKVEFADATGKQMDTLNGKISNLGVAWDNFVNNIYESGVEDAAKWFTDILTDAINWLNKEWVLFLNNINEVIGALDKIGAYVDWVGDRFKAAAGKMSFGEADEKLNSRLSAIEKNVEAMNRMNNAMLNTKPGADRANDAMKKLDKTNKDVADGAIEITKGYKGLTEEEFFRNLIDSSKEFADKQEFALNSFERLDRMFQRGIISQEQYKEANRQLNEVLGVEAQETSQEVENWWQQAANNMQNTMGNVFFDWMQGQMTSLSEAFKRMIDRMVAELIASNLMSFLFGNFGSTGNMGGLVGSMFRADGGPVSANEPYIVGERGPELFVPSTSGNVVSNEAMASVGKPQINMSFQSLDPQENFRIFEQNARRIAELVNTTNATYNLRTA